MSIHAVPVGCDARGRAVRRFDFFGFGTRRVFASPGRCLWFVVRVHCAIFDASVRTGNTWRQDALEGGRRLRRGYEPGVHEGRA